MQKETKSQSFLHPLEYWKQWSEMTANVWTNAIHNDRTVGVDFPDFYTSWMQAANTMQEGMTNNLQALLDPQEAWKVWLNTTMDVWRSAANTGGDPLGVIAGWVTVMESVQEKVLSGKSLSIDPFALFNEWYNTMSKPWSKLTEDIIGSEQFVELTGPLLESQSNLVSVFRRASEAYFKALRLPTLSDITHVAELIVALEEKVDNIEEAVEHLKEQIAPDRLTKASTPDLEQRLHRLESKQDKVLTFLELLAARSAGS